MTRKHEMKWKDTKKVRKQKRNEKRKKNERKLEEEKMGRNRTLWGIRVEIKPNSMKKTDKKRILSFWLRLNSHSFLWLNVCLTMFHY